MTRTANPTWDANGRRRELLEVTGYTSIDGDLIVRGVWAFRHNGELVVRESSVYAEAIDLTPAL